jgi:glycosyltransferase involved in cell wall biosynthesis
MSLSIIIPTYSNVEFLDELFGSIKKNEVNFPFEVLVGIDCCEKTKDYVRNNQFPPNFFFFYFLENVGPYKIKNTLAEISKYDNLFFFDSDDIMMDSCLSEMNNLCGKYECVKPKFTNFKDTNVGRTYQNSEGLHGEGVFGIHKNLFLSMNGFEGWRCAADSDFMGRLYKMRRKVNLTSSILFYRRLHSKSLTLSRETGYASQIRGKYFKISKNKADHGPLPTLEKADYRMLDNDSTEWSEPISVIVQNEVDVAKEMKDKKHRLLDSIFRDSPKEIKQKEIKVIDYNKINRITNTNTSSVLGDAIKKAKLENLKKNYGRR